MRNWKPHSVNNFIYWSFVEVSCELSVSGDKRTGHTGLRQLHADKKARLAIHWTLSAQRLSLVEKLDPITHQQTAWNVSSFTRSLNFEAILASAAGLSWHVCVIDRERYATCLPEHSFLPLLHGWCTFSVLVWLFRVYVFNTATKLILLKAT